MRIFFLLAFLLMYSFGFAQELPLNSQIFINPYFYNPAYAGSEDRPAIFLMRRQQWTGIEGAPVTSNLSFHTLIKKNVLFGANFTNDVRSILNTSTAALTVGYRANFSDYDHLNFAISGGVGFNNTDLSAINIPDMNDPALLKALDHNMFLVGNAGINYFVKGLNLSFSLPHIFRNRAVDTTSFHIGDISPLDDFILMSSYRWEISEGNFAMEPYLVYYHTKSFPGQFEVMSIFHIQDVVWFGGSYRQDYGASGFVGFNVNDNFKLGYAYEFMTNNTANFTNSTHDIQLAMIFGKKKRKKGKLSIIERRRNMLRAMGKIPQKPQDQSKSLYKVEKDPFKQPPEATPKPEPKKELPKPTENKPAYSEEQALQDLMKTSQPEKPVQKPAEKPVAKPKTVEKPVVVPEKAKTAKSEPKPETKPGYSEEQALQDLLNEMNADKDTATVVKESPKPKPQTKAPEPKAEVKPPSKPATKPVEKPAAEPALKEITFEQQNTLTEEKPAKNEDVDIDKMADQMLKEVENAPKEYLEPTIDKSGKFPKTVKKGTHLLELEKGFYVVVGTFGGYRAAEEYSDKLFIKGFYTKFGYISQTKIYYVYAFMSDNQEEANDTSERLKSVNADFKENWVLTVK